MLGHVLRWHSDFMGEEVRRWNCVVFREVGDLKRWGLHVRVTWTEVRRKEAERTDGEGKVETADGTPRMPELGGVEVV